MKLALQTATELDRSAVSEGTEGGQPPVTDREHPLAAQLRRVLENPQKFDLGAYADVVGRIRAELQIAAPGVIPEGETDKN